MGIDLRDKRGCNKGAGGSVVEGREKKRDRGVFKKCRRICCRRQEEKQDKRVFQNRMRVYILLWSERSACLSYVNDGARATVRLA